MNTGTLSYGDIHDKEKGLDVGVGVSVDFGGGKSADKKIDNAKNDNTKSSSKISSDSLGYGATDREQINRGTIGKGTVIVGGIKVTPGINRDEGKSQEVTKDINVDKIDVEYTADRRNWGDTSNIMGEYSQTLTSDIDNVAGTKLNKKYGNVGQTSWLWVEDKVDKAGNKYIGIIPTKYTSGGVAGLEDNLVRGGEKILITTYEYGGEELEKDKNGNQKYGENGKPITKINLKPVVKEYTPLELKKAIKNGKVDMDNIEVGVNGVLNFKDSVSDTTWNLTHDANDIAKLRAGKTVQKLTIFNPSNGIIGDVIESFVGMGAAAVNSNFNTKDMQEILSIDPRLSAKLAAHSQGTIKTTGAFNAMNSRGDISFRGKDITFAGTPMWSGAINSLGTEISTGGGSFKSLVNPWDLVAVPSNANTTGARHPSKYYNRNEKINPKTGKYEKTKKLQNIKFEYETPIIIEGDKK